MWANLLALTAGAESSPDDVSPFRQVEVSAQSEALAIDLSETWVVTKIREIGVAYSSVGWEMDPVDSGNTVTLSLRPADGSSAKVTIASGLTGANVYSWTPSGVTKTTYCLLHEVMHGAARDAKQDLVANFDFSNCDTGGATAKEILEAAFADGSQSYDFSSDEENPWQPIGGSGEGVLSEAGVPSVFVVRVKGGGSLSFGYLLTTASSDALRVLVDGVEVTKLNMATQWAEDSLTIDSRGEHIVTFAFEGTDGQAGVKGIRWRESEGVQLCQLSDPVTVDLQEGVRTPSRLSDILPFEYSSTNWIGDVVGISAESVARVTIVGLKGTDPDVRNWTDEVPGTFATLLRKVGEGQVKWKPHQGVWLATFDILNDDSSIHQESVIFDLRKSRAAGLVLFIR